MTDDEALSRIVRESMPAFEAPASLHEWARAQTRARQSQATDQMQQGVAPLLVSSASRTRRRALYAAGLVAAALLGWSGRTAQERRSSPVARTNALVAELVDNHVRSLMADHLMDVRSTDQHTVKPWFAGKVDFVPRVVDLAPVGFPLLGGRVDYIQGHPAATLVYGRRRHVINLLMWPAPQEPIGASDAPLLSPGGYAVVHWVAGGLSYWAISDAAPAELVAFRQAYRSTELL